MKKLLLGTAAVAMGLSFAAGSAHAQVSLDVGGHTKLYGSWLDQDTRPDNAATAATDESLEERSLDILRETEVHFTGETTLDNGLTVGAHVEVDIDGTDDSFAGTDAEEAYAYFSGAWGRVNFGREDGAAYLLQVAAPSADSNYDGIRQWVSPVNYTLFQNAASVANDAVGLDELFNTGLGALANNTVIVDDGDNVAPAGGVASTDILINTTGTGAVGFFAAGSYDTRFDYDQAISGYADKLTYMTPVFNGFQAGVSYSPEGGASADFGNGADDTAGDYGDFIDVAARYEGQFDQIGVAIGGGWSKASLEAGDGTVLLYTSGDAAAGFQAGGGDVAVATADDRTAWNVGVDLDWMAFGLGAAYLRDDNGVSGDNFETETWVVGLDYTTGPFKIGATYYDQNTDIAGADVDLERYTGGVVYTYGPGMTFRGSVSWLEHEENLGFNASSADATTVLLGTQINF